MFGFNVLPLWLSFCKNPFDSCYFRIRKFCRLVEELSVQISRNFLQSIEIVLITVKAFKRFQVLQVVS